MSNLGNNKRKYSTHNQNPYLCQTCNSHNCNGSCSRTSLEIKLKRSIIPKKRKISIIKANTPNNIKDLIKLSQTEDVTYSNINTPMLKNITPQLIELDTLIGMTDLKDTIFNQVLYYLQDMHKINKNDFLHTCIMGAPGTGKTTVAKIIAEIYKNSDILSKNGIFKTAGRADLIGKYLGQTSPKTKELLESCIGGVLFIDEIYSLGSGEDKGTDSFSKECVDCINQFLSEHKNDFCLIIAGYETEIQKCFFSINAGLKRRFPWIHNIKEYEPIELSQITLKILKDINWKTTITVETLSKIIEKEKNMFEYAGGSVENWISKVKLAHSRRVFPLDYDKKYNLTEEDFIEGLSKMKKHDLKTKETEPPSCMYT